MDTLNVLRGGLPATTNDTQFLKSHSGLALSLFNFCRFMRPLVYVDYSTYILRKERALHLWRRSATVYPHGYTCTVP